MLAFVYAGELPYIAPRRGGLQGCDDIAGPLLPVFPVDKDSDLPMDEQSPSHCPFRSSGRYLQLIRSAEEVLGTIPEGDWQVQRAG